MGRQKLLRDTLENEPDLEARLFGRSAAGEAMPAHLGHVVKGNVKFTLKLAH